MKSKKYSIIRLFVVVLMISIFNTWEIYCQNENRDIIQRAMKDELQRNLNELALENLKSPFFISYNICDVKSLSIKASLGSITTSEKRHFRPHRVRTLVGDYKMTAENFVDNLVHG